MANDSTSGNATPSATASPNGKEQETSVGELVEFVKTYAKQETLGPLKGAGSWLGWGIGGAFLLGLGLVLVLLGVLRLIQAEWTTVAEGSWSWAAYALTLVVTLVFLALTVSRIKKSMLNKPE